MITRIEVDGFKSLRGFALDFEPFTMLIGPNSAGKSNVLDALALLSRLASQPIAEAFKHGRGKSMDQFSRRGAEVAPSIRFAVELLVYGDRLPPTVPPIAGADGFQSRFRYELTIARQATRSGVERLIAREERLLAMRREDDAWVTARPAFAAYAGYADAGEDCLAPRKDDAPARVPALGAASPWPSETHLPAPHTALANAGRPDVALVQMNLRECRVFEPGAARLGESSERIDSGELWADAGNLPTVLAELAPDLLGVIRADLASLVPGIASFDVGATEDEIRLEFELSGGERMPARLVSGGTLRVLALLTALRMDPRPFMLCIEEPENGIYPGRLRALLDLLREVATRTHEEDAGAALRQNQLPTQILLTTHSPVALAALRATPQHLRFVDMVRREGARVTRVRTVGKPVPGDHGRLVVAPREIDALLESVDREDVA